MKSKDRANRGKRTGADATRSAPTSRELPPRASPTPESGPANPNSRQASLPSPARPANPKAADLARVQGGGRRTGPDDEPGGARQRQPEHAEGRRARPVAPRGLSLSREDHPLRPRAHSGAHRARARQRALTGTSRSTRACRGTRRRASSRTPASAPRSSCASPPSPARAARPTWRATSAASPSSSTRRRATSTSSGNNMPVFFIQDAIKFPDLIHAVKPEPDNEMPQAASAHDTFWDFISLMPESMHMIMWVMSDRAIPRSFRMMEGFGVHTFRFIDADGRVALRQVPLEAPPRHALGGLGRGPEDLGQGPRLPPPRPLGGDRAGQLPGVGARRAGRRGGARARVRLRPAGSDEDHPGGARARRAHRPADPQSQPRQLLRRDRAGRLPPRPHRARASTSPTTRSSRAGSSPTRTRS